MRRRPSAPLLLEDKDEAERWSGDKGSGTASAATAAAAATPAFLGMEEIDEDDEAADVWWPPLRGSFCAGSDCIRDKDADAGATDPASTTAQPRPLLGLLAGAGAKEV